MSFTQEQMTRPLFEEPTEAIERTSPYEKKGFLVGGGANQKFQHLSQQYYDAAYLLCESIKNDDWEDYKLANPVLFLYRHHVELCLKAILEKSNKTHNLAQLSEDFKVFIKDTFEADVPEWITNRIDELAAIDPGSTAFRYSQNYCKTSKKDVLIDGEYHVDLQHLQSAMSALNTALIGVVAAVACGEEKTKNAEAA